MKRLQSRKGVTLLEVMIAVAVASIALVSFVSLVLSSLDMEDHARRVTEATLLADDRMKEVERGGFPELGEKEGLVNEEDPNGYAYEQAVSETPIENVRLVKMTIFWNNRKESVSLEAYTAKR